MDVGGMTADETRSGEMSMASPRRKVLQTMARRREEG